MSDVQMDPSRIAVETGDLLPVGQQVVQPPPLPSQPVAAAAPTYPDTPGHRLGTLRVNEWIANTYETFTGTIAYLGIVTRRNGTILQEGVANFISDLTNLSAKIIRPFVWGDHLRTPATKRELEILSMLVGAVFCLDLFIWFLVVIMMASGGWTDTAIAMATGAFVATIAATMNAATELMNILGDRSEDELFPRLETISTKNGETITRPVARPIFSRSRMYPVARLGITVLLSLLGGFVLIVVSKRHEAETVMRAQERARYAEARTQLRAVVDADISTRLAATNAQGNGSMETWARDRAAARATLVQDRAKWETDQRRAIEARNGAALQEMGGGFSGQRGFGHGSQDQAATRNQLQADLNAHQAETVTVLAAFDRETEAGRVSRANPISNDRSDLMTEKRTRLAEIDALNEVDLERRTGIPIHKQPGFWDYADAVRTYNNAHQWLALKDLLFEVTLVGFNMLPLLAALWMSAGTRTYLSLRAHALANDGTEICAQAMAAYRHVLLRDESVQAFERDCVNAYAELVSTWTTFMFKVGEAVRKKENGLTLRLPELHEQIHNAWKSCEVQKCIDRVNFLEARAIEAQYTICAPRSASFVKAMHASFQFRVDTLVALGYVDEEALHAEREEKKIAYRTAQAVLENALRDYRFDFGQGKPSEKDRPAARAFFQAEVVPALRAFEALDIHFRSRDIPVPNQITRDEQEPASQARALLRQLSRDGLATARSIESADIVDSLDSLALADQTKDRSHEAGAPRTDTQPGPRRFHVVRNDPSPP